MRRCLYAALLAAGVYMVVSPPSFLVYRARSLGLRSSEYVSAIEEFQGALKGQDWQKTIACARRGLKKRVLTREDIEQAAVISPVMSDALSATDALLSLKEKTGLHFSEAFPIVLFAQTQLSQDLEKGVHYWPESKYGRELQFDPQRKRLFIHLGTNGVKRIGKGTIKMVTKTILYDPVSPEVMARGEARSKMRNERLAMELVEGLPCVQQIEAFMHHYDQKSKKNVYSLVTKLYTLGSLKNVIEKKVVKLSRSDRLQIASDIITGLAQLHEKGIVHRDLGLKNYFLAVESESPRVIRAIVADMGKSRFVSDVQGVRAQGNTNYIAPEGFLITQMKGDDYLRTDLFTVGCVLWRLYFGSSPKWTEAKYYNKYILKPKIGSERLLAEMGKIRKEVMKKHKGSSVEDRFVALILKLTDPDPDRRGTAKEMSMAFQQLLTEAQALA